MKYLEHLFSANGMEPDPEKIAAVHDWSIPCNVNELRSQVFLTWLLPVSMRNNFPVPPTPLTNMCKGLNSFADVGD